MRLGVDPRARRSGRARHGRAAGRHGQDAFACSSSPTGDKARKPRRPAPISSAPSTLAKIKEGWLDFDVHDRDTRPDGAARSARPRARSARTHAEPEGRHGDDGRRRARSARSKAGKIEFRVDKAGNVHAAIGKVSFSARSRSRRTSTRSWTRSFASKPSSSKGVYVRNVSVSSTMGPGVQVDHHPLPVTSDEENREGTARRRAEREAERAPRRCTTPTSPG